MAGYSYGYGGAYGAGGTVPTQQDVVGGYNPRYHFAAAQDAGFDTGSDESNPRTIYVGNLHQSVTEDFVSTLFGQIGIVTKTKVIYDGTNDPYAFVEFADHYTASQALTAMNKRKLMDKEMKVNWATQPGSAQKVDTSKHFHIFVGDLSPEVDNKALKDAFAPFGDVSDAKVIRDLQTLKSKGYGFVSFIKKEEAERAIEQMNGQWLGRRTIRTNWATRKPAGWSSELMQTKELNRDEVFNQTGPNNCTVYVGGITPGTTEDEMRRAFNEFGQIQEVRIFKQQGYAFVRFDNKDAATQCIVRMNGQEVNGQTVRCSWGRAGQDGSYPGSGSGAQTGYGAYGYGYGGGMMGAHQQQQAAANNANMQQQYWNYYQQYYNNPQLMQQWQNYWQQTQGQQ